MNTADTKYEIGRVPDDFYYGFLGGKVLVPLISLFARVKVKPDKEFAESEGPIIVISTHDSYLDPAITAKLTLGRKVNFVTGEFLFRSKFWGHAFKTGGAIPKKQFVTDAVSVKSMIKVLKRGGVLVVYPEATRSVDGTTIGFDDGIAKMAKKAGAAVYIEHIHGAYMAFPRWSKSGIRFGPITSEFVRRIKADEVANMSAEELHEEIMKAMKYDENEWIRKQLAEGKKLSYGGSKLAVGLQNIAYMCPKCKSEFKMSVNKKKDGLICSDCGNEVIYTKTGAIVPKSDKDIAPGDLAKWTALEQESVHEQLSDENFKTEINVRLFKVYDDTTFAHTGNGKVTVTNSLVKYEGTDCEAKDGIQCKKGKPVRGADKTALDKNTVFTEKEFHIASMRGLVASYGSYFEIYDSKGELYRFYAAEGEGNKVYKIQQIVQLVSKRRA